MKPPIDLLKTHSKIALRFVAHKNLYCIHKSMHGAELPRHLRMGVLLVIIII
jgi:hypothetical protein